MVREADGGSPVLAPPAHGDAAGALARAWDLKQQCYAAWTSEPQRAAQAADALRQLADAWPALDEVQALALWTAGVVRLNLGRMADAVAQLDASAAVWQRLGRPLEAAQTQVPKVMALSMLGHHDQAVACGAAARQTFVSLGDLAAASRLSLNLGSMHMRRDDYADAARHYRQAAVLFARARDTEHSVMADIGLGDALSAQADFDEAARIYSRARMRAGQHGLPLMQALADESMALLELARGAYDAALAGLERARRSYAQLALPQHSAIAEKQLADAYLALRLLPEALALYDRALPSMAALDMPDDRAWTALQRGRTLSGLAQPALAAQALAEAAVQFAAQGSVPGQAAVALAQAELALDRAAALAPATPGSAQADGLALTQATAAQAHAAQAAALFQDAGQPEGAVRAGVLQAAALLRLGDAASARVLYARGLRQAQTLHARGLQIRCQAGVGLAALAQGDDGAAARALQAAVERFESQWRALPGDELRGAFFADHLAPYQGLLALALKAHDAQPGAATAARVLQRLDSVRARALAERLRAGAVPGDDTVADDLRARLQWLHRRLQRQADEGSPSATLTEALHRAERDLLEQARRQRLARPAAAGTTRSGLSVPALRAALQPADALVVQARVGDELLVCIVRRGGVQVLRRMASFDAVLAAWRLARFQLDALRHGAAPLMAHLPVLERRAQQRLQALHDLVWAPLADTLTDARRVLLVPAEGLAGLPFAALHDGLTSLAQRHQLAQAPSVQVALHGLQRPPVLPQRVVALGESSRLPHAGAEAAQVAGMFAQGQAFTGADATLAVLQQHAAEADVLHLACHAQFRGDNPMFSALHLHDGPLTAERAEALRLRAGVVVLSACETGLAGQTGGDEQVGLVRAFLVAGAARVLASLWPVDDAITAVFMDHFYRALQRGLSPAQALGEAQTAVMCRHPHPAFWSGFVLFGGW